MSIRFASLAKNTLKSGLFSDRIVQLVEQMLALHQQLAEAKTPPQKSMIQKQINVRDRQIDQLVYELYELTAEEIAIVEGK